MIISLIPIILIAIALIVFYSKSSIAKKSEKAKLDFKKTQDLNRPQTLENHGELRRNGQAHGDGAGHYRTGTDNDKIIDNTIKLDGYKNVFSQGIKDGRTQPVCPINQETSDNTTVNTVNPAVSGTVHAYVRSGKISTHANNVLEEMSAAESVSALDALWAKHGNHMPFADYVAVKREYENMRRNFVK